MTPREIFQHLDASDSRTDEAWRALDDLTRDLTKKVGRTDAATRDELVQQVLVNLVLLRDRRALPIPASDAATRSYVGRALKNEYIDHVRATKRVESMDGPRNHGVDAASLGAELEAEAALSPDPAGEAGAVFARLDRVFEHGLALEPRADRAVRETGWQQIKLLALEPLDVRAVLERTGRLSASASQAELQTARTSMYKVHERVRSALLAGIEDLKTRGEIDAAAEAELKGQVARLRRRQKRSRTSSH